MASRTGTIGLLSFRKGCSSLLFREEPAFRAFQQRGSAALAEEAYDEPPVNSKDGKVLHPDLINPDMKKTVYAVRGELMQRGEELRKAGREIIFTNSTFCVDACNLYLD